MSHSTTPSYIPFKRKMASVVGADLVGFEVNGDLVTVGNRLRDMSAEMESINTEMENINTVASAFANSVKTIKDFGGVADDPSFDNTAAIYAAAAYGAPVLFPPGVYHCDGEVIVPAGSCPQFYGLLPPSFTQHTYSIEPGASVIRCARVLCDSIANGARFFNIAVDSYQTATPPAFMLTNTQDAQIENCLFVELPSKTVGVGLRLVDVNYSRINNCVTSGVGSFSLAGASHISVSNVTHYTTNSAPDNSAIATVTPSPLNGSSDVTVDKFLNFTSNATNLMQRFQIAATAPGSMVSGTRINNSVFTRVAVFIGATNPNPGIVARACVENTIFKANGSQSYGRPFLEITASALASRVSDIYVENAYAYAMIGANSVTVTNWAWNSPGIQKIYYTGSPGGLVASGTGFESDLYISGNRPTMPDAFVHVSGGAGLHPLRVYHDYVLDNTLTAFGTSAQGGNWQSYPVIDTGTTAPAGEFFSGIIYLDYGGQTSANELRIFTAGSTVIATMSHLTGTNFQALGQLDTVFSFGKFYLNLGATPRTPADLKYRIIGRFGKYGT